MKRFCLVLAVLLVWGLFANSATKYVGGDISLLTKYEERGAIYYNENGARITNVLNYLKSTGMNARVKAFARIYPTCKHWANVSRLLDSTCCSISTIVTHGLTLLNTLHPRLGR